ncbi:hypothetical protein ABTX77_30120 [Streptomyces sp. NPDC097704]|uniref:hypothetical protein n=1 Tax=Streptomyces sp. NPDC097704 TaxID=3157101 RepID=UPI003329A2DA
MAHQSTSRLRARLVDQAASDLEENRRRQLELAKKIELLKQEEVLLISILDLAERCEGLSEPPPLPEQAQEEPVLDGVRTPRTHDSAPAGTPARNTASGGRAARAAAKGKSRPPLLGDLLTALLADHRAPRPAKELRDELREKHPTRNPTPQVVRNTLESLVAKGQILRHKQQRSVTYTIAESGRGGDATPTS